jgi:hypothetical protein
MKEESIKGIQELIKKIEQWRRISRENVIFFGPRRGIGKCIWGRVKHFFAR